MTALVAALCYGALAAVLLRRWPATDNEAWYVGVARERETVRWRNEFGTVIPARQTFRLPAEFALWAWAPNLTTARLVGMTLGAGVTAGAVLLAEHWGGWSAGVLTALVLLTNRYLVQILGTASYVHAVAGLWLLACWGALDGLPWLAVSAGLALMFLRASAWGMALVACATAGWLGLAVGALGATALIVRYPDVVAANGWVRWLRRQPCPIQGLEHGGWGYAASVAWDRYSTVAIWALVAGLYGRAHPDAILLVGLTVVAYLVSHLPRMRLRPKWAVGYWPEHGPAIAVAIGLWLR